MFEFVKDIGNYAERKVDRFENETVAVSTARASDSTHPFETAIKHADYNNGAWIIVELYNSKEEAQTGHKKWVGTMTSTSLPDSLVDVSGANVAKMMIELGLRPEREVHVRYKSQQQTS